LIYLRKISEKAMSHDTNKFGDSSNWNKAAEEYEKGTAGLTRRLGIDAINLVEIPDNSVIHDNACGPGIITEEIIKMNSTVQIDATDFSDSMVGIVKSKIEQNGWANVKASVQNSLDLNFEDNRFDLSITNFGLMFSEDPASIRHIFRTLKPGGKAIVTTWASFGHYDFADEVAFQIVDRRDPPVGNFVKVFTNGWKNPKWIKEAFEKEGFVDIQITQKEDKAESNRHYIKTPNNMFKDAFSTTWNEEEKARWQPVWEKLLQEKIDAKEGLKMTAMFTVATKPKNN